MLTAIKYNLAHLLDFNGRDARSTFWFYVLFIVIVFVALSMALVMPMTAGMATDIYQGANQGISEAEMGQRMMERVGSSMRTSMWLSSVLSVVQVLLLGAAFTRRLHDSGRPGWIAGLVAVVQIAAVGMAVLNMDKVVEMMALAQAGDIEGVRAMQGQFALQGVLGYIPLIVVIVFGVWPSTKGANRYGPQPGALDQAA